MWRTVLSTTVFDHTQGCECTLAACHVWVCVCVCVCSQQCYGLPLLYAVPPGYWVCKSCKSKRVASKATTRTWTASLTALASEEHALAVLSGLSWYVLVPIHTIHERIHYIPYMSGYYTLPHGVSSVIYVVSQL